ncbi:MAG: cupin domain-containing protein, partial [Pseudomonadota bacterium]
MSFQTNKSAAVMLSLALSGGALAQADGGLKITRNGSVPAVRGAAENFSGNVRVEMPFRGDEPARVSGGLVTFEAKARTAWHTHPLGQTLIVTEGVGLVQRAGGPIHEIRRGDIVWIPPGEKHWHGASATSSMSHYAIAEQLNGKAVDWLEKVADAAPAAAAPPATPTIAQKN